MRSFTRMALLAALVLVLSGVAVSAAEGAFGVKSFFASVCKAAKCSGETEKLEEALGEAFLQAAGHPNYGVTDIKFNTVQIQEKPFPAFAPSGNVKTIKTALPEGLVVNPQAVTQCAAKELEEAKLKEGAPPEPEKLGACLVGENQLTVLFEVAPGVFANPTVKTPVFNIVPREGEPARVGFQVLLPKGFATSYINGGVAWSKDFHGTFAIEGISPEVPIIETRLIYFGNAGSGFLTVPSICNVNQTTLLEVEDQEGHTVGTHYETPIGAQNCAAVPFAPTIEVKPGTTKLDEPNPATVELGVPQGEKGEEIDSSTLKEARIAFPPGLTLDPSVATVATQACTDEQIGIGTTNPVACPAPSQIGTVAIEVPTLPPESLKGAVYLGRPREGEARAGRYRMFLDAESARYGVSVRLEGTVVADPLTGQLTATFAKNPQAPFKAMILKLGSGAAIPLANPLACGPAGTATSIA
ncbi:MAG TPA: hypothetical protein VGX16_02055, partial [Solirubrobacteraceae bacterium]|nr:hypothetical protein [Solirubrobacteraceae bacterium]